jgi:hypothetical protein
LGQPCGTISFAFLGKEKAIVNRAANKPIATNFFIINQEYGQSHNNNNQLKVEYYLVFGQIVIFCGGKVGVAVLNRG